MHYKYNCLALFSGGLDSILACKLMQSQGLKVLGVHYLSPFFGDLHKAKHWQEIYGIDILPLDVSSDFINSVLLHPKHGFGKYLNPCIDCKFFMLKKTKELLSYFGAQFIITGEVLGQRPMSQRREVMNLITKEAGVNGFLLRPLSAGFFPTTPMEASGLVNRDQLLRIKGRSRKQQLKLAEEFNLQELPTPAGGCLLADPECSKRFLSLFKYLDSPRPQDFQLCKVGRQYWYGFHWLVIGRNQTDNQNLLEIVEDRDIIFKLAHIPGPIAIGRQLTEEWSNDIVISAARFMLHFSPKALNSEVPVTVNIGHPNQINEIQLDPYKTNNIVWKEPTW